MIVLGEKWTSLAAGEKSLITLPILKAAGLNRGKFDKLTGKKNTKASLPQFQREIFMCKCTAASEAVQSSSFSGWGPILSILYKKRFVVVGH